MTLINNQNNATDGNNDNHSKMKDLRLGNDNNSLPCVLQSTLPHKDPQDLAPSKEQKNKTLKIQ